MNYRFSPRRVVGFTAAWAGTVAYVMLKVGVRTGIPTWLLVVLIAVPVLAIGWWIWDAREMTRHHRTMAKFARVNNWHFETLTRNYAVTLRSFPFGRGINQRDEAVIRGTFNGRRCTTFTHAYEEGADERRTWTEMWQITLVELDFPLATVDIVPDELAAKAAKALGGMDVDFESAAFNAKWRVKSGNLKYAHDIVHPRVMERLLRPDADGLAISIEGAAILCWQADWRGPDDLARRLGVLTSLAKLIPEFVLKEFEYEWNKVEEVERQREEAARQRDANAPKWATTPFALTAGRYTGAGQTEARDLVNDGPPPKDPHTGADDRES